MDPNTTHVQNTGDLALLSGVGNPLDIQAVETDFSATPSILSTEALVPSEAIAFPDIPALDNLSSTTATVETIPTSIKEEVIPGTTVPPTPIKTDTDIASVPPITTPITQKTERSGILGITIGIFFLISLIVGASLYYYFYMYKKTALTIPTKKDLSQTLIKTEVPQKIEVATETIATLIEENLAIDTAVNFANNDPALADDSLSRFDEALK